MSDDTTHAHSIQAHCSDRATTSIPTHLQCSCLHLVYALPSQCSQSVHGVGPLAMSPARETKNGRLPPRCSPVSRANACS
eukprot:7817859-Alexandrium_andersonii.AAC.1